jgi:UDP-N-acetyl-D-mannosaminuronic acid dehydrogenase
MSPLESVCVIGLGQIGLPAAILLAECGLKVTGVDIRDDWIGQLDAGTAAMDEPGLTERYVAARQKELTFATKPVPSDVFLIAVPTPVKNYTADLSLVEDAVVSLLPVLHKNNLLILESTVPPMTTDVWMSKLLKKHRWDPASLDIAHCPERVLPGSVLAELIGNARIVGGTTPQATERAGSLYRLFVKGEILETTAVNAETAKLMENTYRDVNIALSNELVKISSVLPIEPLEIIRMANYHPRVQLLQPGPGVGGHCIAVDPYFLVEKAIHHTPLIQKARTINDKMPYHVASRVLELISTIADPKVAVFGLAYKGNVSDTRESPALRVLEYLVREGIRLALHDPKLSEPKSFFGLACTSAGHAAENSDLLLVLADHEEFRDGINDALISRMRRPLVVDTRNILTEDKLGGAVLLNFNNLFSSLRTPQREQGKAGVH